MRELIERLPVPDLDRLPSGEWSGPSITYGSEATAILLAVLRAYAAPMDQNQARLAALYVAEPERLVSQGLSQREKDLWLRACRPNVAVNCNWLGVPQRLIARGYVRDDLYDTWHLGEGHEVIDTRGWPDGRAQYVLCIMARNTTTTGSKETP